MTSYLLGLVTLSCVVAAWKLGPGPADVARGFVPSLADHDRVRYAFLAVSILGATVTPYLVTFHSSGTVEEKLTEDKLWVNRTTAYVGTMFGSAVSMGVLLAERIRLAFGRWVAAIELACGIAEGRPLRIPFIDILTISDDVKVDCAMGETSAAAVERVLRRVVSAIPGSS